MLNVVCLQGRLTHTPEIRKSQAGESYLSCSIAVARNYVKKGDTRETDFINLVAWRGTADIIGKYFKKGDMILVNGSLQARKYKDKEGNLKTTYEVLVQNVNFPGSKENKEKSEEEFLEAPF